MSSRVQKGGQKFKPVVKARGRPNESSPAPPRKPVSARGTTTEPNTTQTSKPQSQDARLAPAPISASASASQRRDVSVTVTTLGSTSAAHDGRTQKPLSSSSVGGVDRGLGDSASTNDGVSRSHVIDSTTKSAGVDPSPTIPDASSSRPRQVPSVQVSRAASVVQQPQIAPPPASDTSVSGPTLHSLLQGITPVANAPTGVLQSSQKESTDVETATGNGTGSSEHQELATVPDELQTRVSPRRSRNTSKATSAQRTVDDDGMAGDDGQSAESRVRRKRKPSTRSRKTSDGPSSGRKTRASTEHKLRRSNRTRRSTSARIQVQEESNGSDAKSSESESESEPRRQKRRRSSTTSTSMTARGKGRGRGKRSGNPVIFDVDAGPGEDLDPTVATMAAICNDTGQGRVSSKTTVIQLNHIAWKAASRQKREKMRGIMEAKKYGRQYEEDEAQAQNAKSEKDSAPDENEVQTADSPDAPAVENTSGDGFNYREAHAVNRFSARVRIGPNGETIIDEESLFVDRAENADEATENYQHVEESDQTKFTNSASYGRKLRGSRWSAEETELFFDALSQFGENYELISYVLPGRDRKSCKAKFKSEDKKNPGRINYCLNNRIPYDIQTLSRLTGRDFSGPTPEIKIPDAPEAAEVPQQQQSEAASEPQSEPESLTRKVRKKSKTPNIPDDVEVVGDIDTFDGASDG